MAHMDCLVIGAGFAGAVLAEELARRGQRRVLILERRAHIGGNAYDEVDTHGVLVHRYGPHIFHTADQKVFEYLSQYTAWNGYAHQVAANVPAGTGDRLLFPVPFNLVSLEAAFGLEKAKKLEKKLLDVYGAEKKVTILELRQSSDPEIAALADYVYEHVFVHYTQKQWGQTPEEIDPATTARVPVFLSRDCRYFQDPYQGLPTGGYTALFEKLLNHPNIQIERDTDAAIRLTYDDERFFLDGEPFDGPILFTGAVDELFQYQFGRLPYRTLDFQFETWTTPKPGEHLEGYHALRVPPFYQTHGTINFTMDQPFTRITEFKHMTQQQLPDVTTIVKEYSKPYTGAPGEIPYYPIRNDANNAQYQQYAALAGKYRNLFLVGRLAEYQYYNMDRIVRRALDVADDLLGT